MTTERRSPESGRRPAFAATDRWLLDLLGASAQGLDGGAVRRLREALQLALILLLFEIVAWFISIAELSS
jgi:hypothetical protein